MRYLPQPAPQDRRSYPRHHGSRQGPGTRRRLGKGHPQIAVGIPCRRRACRRPDAATYSSLAGWLETQIDQASEPYAGRPILHRLNRAEYANAIRDLLALDVDAAALLPPDDSAYGFDNISDALGVSPSLAGALSGRRAEDRRARGGRSEDHARQRNLAHPAGSFAGPSTSTVCRSARIGGTLVRYNFPLDGEYTFQAKLYRTNLNIMRGLESPHQVEVRDGRHSAFTWRRSAGQDDLAALFEKPTDTGDAVDARLRVRVPVKAGPHVVTVAFLADPDAVEPARLQPYLRSSVDNFDWSGSPHLQSFTITGPFHPAGASDTPSRRRIFVCHPGARISAKQACAQQILSTLARRAYREPVSELGPATLC